MKSFSVVESEFSFLLRLMRRWRLRELIGPWAALFLILT